MEYSGLIKNRRSVRAFRPEPLSKEQIKTIADSANLAPSAGNLQSYVFYVAVDKGVKEKVASAAMGQGFISEAPAVFVFFAKAQLSARKYGERGKLYSLIDATIAAAYAQLAAENLGLGSVWVGAYDDDAVRDAFGEDGQPVCILPVGHPAETPAKHPRADRLRKII
ncbi:MAG: nitroreductase family protein [Candidatus Micrarchaeota archaeon]